MCLLIDYKNFLIIYTGKWTKKILLVVFEMKGTHNEEQMQIIKHCAIYFKSFRPQSIT